MTQSYDEPQFVTAAFMPIHKLLCSCCEKYFRLAIATSSLLSGRAFDLFLDMEDLTSVHEQMLQMSQLVTAKCTVWTWRCSMHASRRTCMTCVSR